MLRPPSSWHMRTGAAPLGAALQRPLSLPLLCQGTTASSAPPFAVITGQAMAPAYAARPRPRSHLHLLCSIALPLRPGRKPCRPRPAVVPASRATFGLGRPDACVTIPALAPCMPPPAMEWALGASRGPHIQTLHRHCDWPLIPQSAVSTLCIMVRAPPHPRHITSRELGDCDAPPPLATTAAEPAN